MKQLNDELTYENLVAHKNEKGLLILKVRRLSKESDHYVRNRANHNPTHP